jgi:hypothetical protein
VRHVVDRIANDGAARLPMLQPVLRLDHADTDADAGFRIVIALAIGRPSRAVSIDPVVEPMPTVPVVLVEPAWSSAIRNPAADAFRESRNTA